jgi:tRNA(Arg) A34 adenosine deaminase TadA
LQSYINIGLKKNQNNVPNLFEYKFNHKVEVEKGILKQECKEILQRFFKELRLKRKGK